VKLISFWDPADAGYAMNRLALLLLRDEPVQDGLDLGVEGYRQLRQDPVKTNLFSGSAWVDVTIENLDDYSF
jgi:simple sugar transport system substrate-binding protein